MTTVAWLVLAAHASAIRVLEKISKVSRRPLLSEALMQGFVEFLSASDAGGLQGFDKAPFLSGFFFSGFLSSSAGRFNPD